ISPVLLLFFLILIPPPPSPTLFPYTTLFRSTTVRTTKRIVRLTYFPPVRAVNFRDELRNHRSTIAKPMETWPMGRRSAPRTRLRSEEHTSELQSRGHLVCRLLLEKKKKKKQK